MPYTCPKCSARFSSDETCREHFDAAQLAEIEQPTYYAVHHLSVPCYMLQHNVYSRQGWLAVRDLLFQFVYRGLTPEMARRQYRAQWNGQRRTWSITKGDKLPGVEEIAWTLTIADVRLATPEHYCADVLNWAKSILADSADLIQTVSSDR